MWKRRCRVSKLSHDFKLATGSKGYMALKARASCSKSPPYQGLEVIGIVVLETCFSFVTWSANCCNQRVIMWHYGWELLLVSHHLVKFGGYAHCDSGGWDIIVLVCHVVLQDLLSLKSSITSWVTIPPSLKAIDTSRHEMVLVCHIISQDHMLKGHLTLSVGSPYGNSPICQIFCT